MQKMTDTSTDESVVEFVEPVDCLELYPNLPASLSKSLVGYTCPNVQTIDLQGNNGEEGSVIVKEFHYIVNSCEAMVDLRAQFGQPAVQCANYDDVLGKLNSISSNVQLVRKFFAPDQYADDEVLPLAVTFQSNKLNSLLSQVQDLNIAQNHIVFKPNWFNNRLPGAGSEFFTYYIESNSYGVEPIVDQQTSPQNGFVNYKLRQASIQ